MFYITENQLFDYMFCPYKYKMKYEDKIKIPEEKSMSKLLSKISDYFYLKLMDKHLCSMNELKNKWDIICQNNLDYIDSKKNINGLGLIIDFLKWAEEKRIIILDIYTKYNIIADDVELSGCMNPIIPSNDKVSYEILDTLFTRNTLDQSIIDMKLKYTIDSFAFNSVYNENLSGIRIHSVKHNRDFFTNRSTKDFERLKTTIVNISKGIKNKIFYPREQILCNTCKLRTICRYFK